MGDANMHLIAESAVKTAYAAYRIQKVAACGHPFVLRLQRKLLERMAAEVGMPKPMDGFIHTAFGVPVEIVDG